MKIEIIENLEALLDFRSEWERLFEPANTKNIFLSFEWMSLWWKYLAKESKPLILIFKENGEPLGIAPLMIRRQGYFGLPIRKIEFLSGGNADMLDFIIPDKKEMALNELLQFFLRCYTEWDILEFSDICDFSSTVEILESLSNSLELFLEKSVCQRSFYIHSEGAGQLPYIPSFKGLKNDFRKTKNRLSRLGFETHFERLSELDELERLFPIIVDIENRSWKGSAETGIFSTPDKRVFHKKLIESLARKSIPEVVTLKINKEIVAYSYNFRFDSVCQWYNTAYLPEYSRLSPGAFLIYLLIEGFFLNGGREFDFLKGDELWKHRWTSLFRKHFRVRIFNKKPYARLLYSGSKIKSFLKEKRSKFDISQC